jgi:predicted nucleic acid-binding protein
MSAPRPSPVPRAAGETGHAARRGRGTASGFVVDASVTSAWFFEDETTAFTESALSRIADEDGWVPTLWLLECANVFAGAQRRGRVDAATKKRMVERAMALPLRVDREPTPLSGIEWLASEYGLTAYDACYLELAIRRALPLVTLDRALVQAARKAHHPVETA